MVISLELFFQSLVAKRVRKIIVWLSRIIRSHHIMSFPGVPVTRLFHPRSKTSSRTYWLASICPVPPWFPMFLCKDHIAFVNQSLAWTQASIWSQASCSWVQGLCQFQLIISLILLFCCKNYLMINVNDWLQMKKNDDRQSEIVCDFKQNGSKT